MAKSKQSKKPISNSRKAVLKNAYQAGNIESIKTTKKERAYVSKAAGGWARAEKGLKSATGRYYNRNEVKHLQDFLRVSKTDWNSLTKEEKEEIDAVILGSGESLPVTYSYDKIENFIKQNPDKTFIAVYETGTKRKISQGQMLSRLMEMQQIARDQGYTFYTTYTTNRRGEISIKILTKEGLKEVEKTENWQQGNFDKTDINIIKSESKPKKK